MIGGVNMNRSSLLYVFLITTMFILVPNCFGQDRLPIRPRLSLKMKEMKPLRDLLKRKDTIAVKTAFPLEFIGTRKNNIVDSVAILTPIFERLRQIRSGLSDDTVRIVHVGDSHIRGHIFPQTTGNRLKDIFGSVSYIDKGINGGTCLTFTHPDRIAEIAAQKPDLLILSLGTNESYGLRYNANTHYYQIDELVKLLQNSLPGIPILLTTPPGSYLHLRQRKRRRVYSINPNTSSAAETIKKYGRDHQLPTWDLYNIVGGKERACKNWMEAKLMRTDHVHYLPEGYILQGNLLFQALIKAYNLYVAY